MDSFLASAARPCAQTEFSQRCGNEQTEKELQSLIEEGKIGSAKYPWPDGSDLQIFWAREPDDATHSLQNKLQALNQELQNLGKQEYDKEIMRHMNRLHDYNDLKDTAQMLMGQLAILEGLMTRDLYKRYGLDLED